MREKQPKEVRISFAKDLHGKPISIQSASSGRRGYFCLSEDCERELEAVKPLGRKPRPYFRHVASDVHSDHKPCTYSDETGRHKIAKEILVRTKSIRVPKVPKFPPKGYDGPVKQVAPAKTVTAFNVHVERDFYEDENQNLHWGRFEGSDKNFLVRPDVIFFDSSGMPILFIELVATHKPDFEKLAKIKKLGIDTVTVKIPTDSLEEIEECFLNTYNTKWFFNNEQERADYFQLSGSPGERISDVDEIQRSLFAETILCRQNRIRNLIRGFNACVRSESYRRIEIGIQSEITALDHEQYQREQFEKSINAEISRFFGERRTTINKRKKQLERVRGYFKTKEEGLEDEVNFEFAEQRRQIGGQETRILRLRIRIDERYEGKRNHLEQEEERYRNFNEFQGKIPEGKERQFEFAAEGTRRKVRESEDSILNEIREIKSIQNQLDSISETFEKEREGIIKRFSIEGNRMAEKYKVLEGNANQAIQRVISETEKNDRGTGTAQQTAIRQFEIDKVAIPESIKARDISGDTPLSREIKELVSAGRELFNYESTLKAYDRYTEALRFLNKEAFKTWVRNKRVP